ncbi:glycine cleavage system protein H [Ammoniphilus sp. 3BR4]|uniref:glycine cleavage system protein H n=1 Tax=Ammoniphilus sp. 3BR4 TaxID=3158265 RepID=UPI003465CF2D
MDAGSNHLYFTRQHVWVHIVDPHRVKLGITPYACEQLGTIIAVEFPEPSTRVKRGQPVGVVESAKTLTDLYAPVEGEITEVNGSLLELPEKLSSGNAYAKGWIAWMSTDSPIETTFFMNANEYALYIKEE